MADNNDLGQSPEANGQADKESQDQVAQIQELQTNLDKAKSDFLYLKAEFDTYKRNAIKERSELLKYGHERMAVELLNVLDNFERALETEVSPEKMNSYIQGVEMTAKELKALLGRFGIQELAAENVDFDPMMHEALGSEESSELEPGKVLRVFKKPYKLHDKLIRPGQVIVAKKPGQ